MIRIISVSAVVDQEASPDLFLSSMTRCSAILCPQGNEKGPFNHNDLSGAQN
jgi:hypothetical protein